MGHDIQTKDTHRVYRCGAGSPQKDNLATNTVVGFCIVSLQKILQSSLRPRIILNFGNETTSKKKKAIGISFMKWPKGQTKKKYLNEDINLNQKPENYQEL